MFYDDTVDVYELSREEKIALIRDDIDEYRRDCLLESCNDVAALSMTDKMSYAVEVFKAYVLLADVSNDTELVLDFYKEPIAKITKDSAYFRKEMLEVVGERIEMMYVLEEYYTKNIDDYYEILDKSPTLSMWDPISCCVVTAGSTFLTLLFMAVVTYYYNVKIEGSLFYGGDGLEYMVIATLVFSAILFAMYGFRHYHVRKKVDTFCDTIFD